MKYIVRYGYRTDGGDCSTVSTHVDATIVVADDEEHARQVAIGAAYDKRAGISHVKIENVVLFSSH